MHERLYEWRKKERTYLIYLSINESMNADTEPCKPISIQLPVFRYSIYPTFPGGNCILQLKASFRMAASWAQQTLWNPSGFQIFRYRIFCPLHCLRHTAPKIRNKCFQKWKLRGLAPNFCIHVFVSDLYIPMIDPPILLYCVIAFADQLGGIYKSLTNTWM